MIVGAFEEFDLDYATAMAEGANRHMVQHGVAPTPNNFAVLFNYSCDTRPELKRTIDILIAGKRRFDTATNRELFSTYLAAGPAGATDSNVPEQLKSVMADAQRFVAQAIADNHTQIRAIGDVAERAESGIDPRPLVECLMDELTKAAARASKLEINLSETSRELDTIRESLNKAEQRANTDTLTGLLIDIDRFNKFNDNFGHGVGDQVLRLMAKALRDGVRENDLPARYGGEELIAVLPGTELAACEAVAERIRRSVAECQITRRSTGDILPGITVSVGVAQFRPGESMAQFLERCDSALYLAKRTGRNRVVTETRLEGRAVVNG